MLLSVGARAAALDPGDEDIRREPDGLGTV
ncbi:hypothetical protein PS9374_01023 [Planomonospora sphaerica]|uniref:Uncharacterized protein n=1 Tax=Planomonospora sphaerica TaxID=161355 RepID=A0A171BP88_9ACTN|nr:hypothetical protein PS9374_01023 [Planomonospora sphaerica]